MDHPLPYDVRAVHNPGMHGTQSQRHTLFALSAVGEDRVRMMLWSVPFWSKPYRVAVGLLSLYSTIPSDVATDKNRQDKVMIDWWWSAACAPQQMQQDCHTGLATVLLVHQGLSVAATEPGRRRHVSDKV